MWIHVVRRLAAAAILVFLLLSLVFLLLHLAPGEPQLVLLDPKIPAAAQERISRLYGLDQPLWEQYLRWLNALVLHGEWGHSFSRHRPVTEVLAAAAPATVLLSLAAMIVQFGVGILLGVGAARAPGSARDHSIRLVSLVLYSLPLFWIGLLAMLALAIYLPLFPPGHMRSVGAAELPLAERLFDLLWHLALPALVLGLSAAGGTARYVRNSLLDILGEDYIRTAHAKGLSPRRVLWVHALRNAAGPLVQLFGLSLPSLLSGALVIEVVFSWPGMGRVTYEAIRAQDFPVVLASTAWIAVLVVFGTLLADLLQAAVDPRLRHAE